MTGIQVWQRRGQELSDHEEDSAVDFGAGEEQLQAEHEENPLQAVTGL